MDPVLQWALGALVVLVMGAFAVPRLTSGARTKDVEQTLHTMKEALEVERELAKANAQRFTAALEEEREKRHRENIECKEQIAELRGQVQALTGPLAHELVRIVREEAKK